MESKQVLYDNLMSCLGTPYLWGGPHRLVGEDCSGLVIEDFLLPAGLWKPGNDATSGGIYTHFVRAGAAVVTGHLPSFGDLLFFGKDSAGISHIAIALNGTQMIEAGGGRSTTTTLQAAKLAGAYVRVRPITNRTDLVAALRVLP